MPRTAQLSVSHLLRCCVLVALCAVCGCQRTDPVVTYTVPTKIPEQLKPSKDRMLAAMFPKGEDVWFIKVTGPEPAIAEVESEFRRFVETIPFDNGTPDLTSLPEDWRRAGDKPMRVASIDVDTAVKQLDISISKLPKRDDWDSFVADNVNRWRGQLGLERSAAKWAAGTEINIESADGGGVWVDLVGQPPGGSSMSPPFAGGGGPRALPTAEGSAPKRSCNMNGPRAGAMAEPAAFASRRSWSVPTTKRKSP